MGQNRRAKDQLISLYGARCLLTGDSTKELTYHHIEKREHGGPATPDNGAQVIEKAHNWLHNSLELKDPALFDLVNECLQLYKQCMDKGNKELIQQYEQECIPIMKQLIYKRK